MVIGNPLEFKFRKLIFKKNKTPGANNAKHFTGQNPAYGPSVCNLTCI